MSSLVMIVLRLIHVIGGMLWGGAVVFYMFFLKPSTAAIGPAGPGLIQHLAQKRRYPLFMMITSTLTVLAGAILLWVTSAGLNANWLRSGAGMGFGIGSIAALLAYLVGAIGVGPTSAKIGAVGAEIAGSGRPQTDVQASRLQALQRRLALLEQLDFILLAVAMLTMATARYW